MKKKREYRMANDIFYAVKVGDVNGVKKFLGAGADVNPRDKDGDDQTPLHWACRKGHSAIVRLLLDHGADMNARNGLHNTPLDLACETDGHLDIARMLIEAGADVDAKNSAANGKTPLHAACWHGHSDIVRLLIEVAADVNARNLNGNTPLHMACQRGHMDIVHSLLDAGADVNAKGFGNNTPLHRACWVNHAGIAKLLLDHGAEVNAKNSAESLPTPLRIASRPGCVKLLAALIAHGAVKDENTAGPDVKDEISMPLDIAIKSSDPGTEEARESIIDWYREHYPEMVMERFCAGSMAPGGR